MIISNLPGLATSPKAKTSDNNIPEVGNMAKNESQKENIKPLETQKEKEPTTINNACMSYIPKNIFNYIERDIDKDIEFWAQLKNGTPLRNIALIGESGSGKNQAITRYASQQGLPLLVVPCDDSQVLKELLGYWKAQNSSTLWCDGLLTQFLQMPSVILFDEVNCLPSGKLFMLHELLENRKLFVKDAPAEKSIIKIHPEVRLFLAMNPPEARYSGTTRLNTALGTRTSWIEVLPFSDSEIMTESTGNEEIDSLILKFYKEASRIIKEQKLRVTICKRNIDAIIASIKFGLPLEKAVMHSFINSALATASSAERDVLVNLAITVFGISQFTYIIARIKNQ